MMIHEWQTNEQGELLLFDKWANEGNRRVRVWYLPSGDVRIEFAETAKPGEPAYDALTLTRYRADDLAKALARSILPKTP